MRVKGGVVTRRRHKRLLKRAEGFVGRKGNCYRLAKLAVQRALVYSYAHRKARRRNIRSVWVSRINAAVRDCGISYSRFVCGLRKAGIEIDRKVLADLAYNDPAVFAQIAERAKAAA